MDGRPLRTMNPSRLVLLLVLLATGLLTGCARTVGVEALGPAERYCAGTLAACTDPAAFRAMPADARPNLRLLPGVGETRAVTVSYVLAPHDEPRTVALDGNVPRHCVELRGTGLSPRNAAPVCALGEPIFVTVPARREPVELAIETEGVFDARAHKPRVHVGSAESMRSFVVTQTTHIAFVCGWLLLMAASAVNSTIIGRLRRASASLAVLAALYALHTFTNARSGVSGLGLFSAALDRRIELGSMGAIIAAGIEFYGELAPLTWRPLRKATQLVVIALALGNLLLPMAYLPVLLRTSEVMALVWALITARILVAWQGGRPWQERAVVAAGVVALIVGATIDTVQGLRGLPIFGTIGLTSYALAFEIFCQSLLVAIVNAEAHTRAERLAEETLEQRRIILEQNAELQRADSLKDAFLSNTTHELRTPVHGIVGLTEAVLTQASALGDDDRSRLAMVLASGRRLAALINDILDFSKLRAHTLRLRKTRVPLHDAARVALASVEPLAATKRLTLHNEVPAKLLGWVDENRLQQVLVNLLGNAVKFTEAGRITVRAERRGGLEPRVVITVSDTGIGIPEAMQARIFQRFDQGSAAIAERFGGTGLGLSIAREIVRLHGGDLGVTSREGAGATFAFDVQEATETLEAELVQRDADELDVGAGSPRAPAFEDARDATSHLPLAPKPRPSPAEARRLLVADDSPANLEILKALLKPAGYELVCALDGDAALRAFASEGPFDAVLLDVMMPKLSGLEVARRLRETNPRGTLPIVILSAKSRVEDIVAGFEAGADDYVQKPFAVSEMVARLEAKIDARLH